MALEAGLRLVQRVARQLAQAAGPALEPLAEQLHDPGRRAQLEALGEVVQALRGRPEQRLRPGEAADEAVRPLAQATRSAGRPRAPAGRPRAPSWSSRSRRTGTASSAAAVGVGARVSAAWSISVMSVSWPTAEIRGMDEAAAARTTTSSLNAHRSSIEPPPRATITTSGRGTGAVRAAARRSR